MNSKIWVYKYSDFPILSESLRKQRGDKMNIFYIGRYYQFREGATIKDVVGEMEIKHIVVVLVNGAQVRKEEWPSYTLKEGDRVKVRRLFGGG
jgi:thiamine biosynthesis protein ThiS